jgi:repressor LexA
MDISSFSKNIKAIRESSGKTQQEFADSLDILQGTVSSWESKSTLPRQKEVMLRICDTYGVTEQDLFGFSDGFYAKSTGLCNSIAAPSGMTASAPVAGRIAAGDPSEAIEMSGETHELPSSVAEAFPGGFFVIIRGDSMNLVLQEGSYVYIAPADRFPVRNDDIAVVKVNGDDATVKVVKLFDDVVILEPRSTNPEHKRRVIDASDPDSPSVRILGKAVWSDYQITRF